MEKRIGGTKKESGRGGGIEVDWRETSEKRGAPEGERPLSGVETETEPIKYCPRVNNMKYTSNGGIAATNLDAKERPIPLCPTCVFCF